ncbi:MAG: sugar transferase [Deltaproteobacteria bacterium]|nr:sugar transferase [Deltaproteobacteria bacterium]
MAAIDVGQNSDFPMIFDQNGIRTDMLKSHWKTIARIERFADNAIIIAMFFLSYALRNPLIDFARAAGVKAAAVPLSLAPIEDYLVVLAFAIPVYNVVLSGLGAYRSMRLSSAATLIRITSFASAIAFLCLAALLFLLKLDLSRSLIGLFCAFCAVGLFVERHFVLWVLRLFRLRGKNFRNVLIAGTGEQALRLVHEITSRPELGVRVIGLVALALDDAVEGQGIGELDRRANARSGTARRTGDTGTRGVVPIEIVADPTTFEDALKRYATDEVLFTDVNKHFAQIEDLCQICADEGVGVSLAADFFSLEILKSDLSYFGDVPLIHYSRVPADGLSIFLKRVVDALVSMVLIVVLSPLLAVIATWIRFESKGPVFFRQERVGLNGRRFTLLKFRSMVSDAESILPKLQKYNEMTGPVFKMTNDPRITRVGRFLRRYSLDELPQLWNVFRGDMSLVGPRPPLPSEVSHYLRKQRRRLSMRPGMTCTWQINGRNDIPDFEQWAKMDLDYIDNWSLTRDFALLMQTIPAVFRGTGAR